MLGTVVAAVSVAVVLVGIVLAWVVTAVAELREAKATTADLDLVIDHVNQISRDVYQEQDRIAMDVDKAMDDAVDAKNAQASFGTDVQTVRDRVASLEGQVGTISSTYASEHSVTQLTSDVQDLASEVQDFGGVVQDGALKVKSVNGDGYVLLKPTSDLTGVELCEYTAAGAESCNRIITESPSI